MPRQTSLLQCLTPIEKRDFLPTLVSEELSTLFDSIQHIDASDLSEETWSEQLHAANPEILLACWKTPPLPASLPPGLRYVCYLAGSVRKLVSRQHIEAGLLVTNWGDSISRIVAEGALLHILNGLRDVTHWAIEMHLRGGWKNRETTTASLFGRRVGIRGFGRVARELIKLLAPFGCDIGVLAPDLTAESGAAAGLRKVDDLDQLMSDHDIVVELAPLIPATERSIRIEHLRQLRPGSLFVNVGRGATVDEDALLTVAREGRVHIGLDVFGSEPLPVDSGFRGLHNVSLTPHLAGPTSDRRVDAGRFALANLRAYLDDQPLRSLVTLAVYDRST